MLNLQNTEKLCDMLSTIVFQRLTELGKTDFYFTPPFRNCWYYSLLLFNGIFFLKCFCALSHHPSSTGGFLHKLGTKLEGMCRDILFGASESKIYIWNKKKLLEDILVSHFLNQGCNSISCCSTMFYSDPHKLIQLHPSSTLGLVLPTWLQNLPAVLAGESLLACSLSCFCIHP